MTDLEIAVTLFLVGFTAFFSYNKGTIDGSKDLLLKLEAQGIIRIQDKTKN